MKPVTIVFNNKRVTVGPCELTRPQGGQGFRCVITNLVTQEIESIVETPHNPILIPDIVLADINMVPLQRMFSEGE